MSLSKAFQTNKHLGKLASAWWTALHEEMSAKGVSTTVKTVADEAASLIAPAALVAMVVSAGVQSPAASMRVLVLGRDPMFRRDNGRWLSYAGAFLGNGTEIEFLTLIDEDAKTSLGEVALGLKLQASTFVTNDQILDGSCGGIDLVLWVHPTTEIHDEDSAFQAEAAYKFANAGTPVFSCHFNEVDHIAQSVIVGHDGWQFKLLGKAPGDKSYLNRYGIALTGTGVRGGWGAMLSQLVPVSEQADRRPAVDVAAVRCALALLRAEGGGQSGWTLGDTLSTKAGAGSRLIGLLGDMVVDRTYGHVFTLTHEGKNLKLIGYLWADMLKAMPTSLSDLTVWASRLYLNFAHELPPADCDRKPYIAALEDAMEGSLVEGGVGLARCYEASGRHELKLEADRLYRKFASQSPIAAYYMAHKEIDHQPELAIELFTKAADAGYPQAVCDLGLLLVDDTVTREKGLQLLKDACDLGDVTAIYHVALGEAQAGAFEPAKKRLRPAVELTDRNCIELFLAIVQTQLKSGVGDRTKVRRDQSWARTYLKKLDTQDSAVA